VTLSAVHERIVINNSIETFTPTQSGALATIIYECCRVAARNGKQAGCHHPKVSGDPVRMGKDDFARPSADANRKAPHAVGPRGAEADRLALL